MAIGQIKLRLRTEAIRKKLLARRNLLTNSPENCNDFFANCCNCCGTGTGTGACRCNSVQCGNCCIPYSFVIKSTGDPIFNCISSSFSATMTKTGTNTWTGSGTDGSKTFNLTVTCTDGQPILSVTCSGSGDSSGDFILFGTPISYTCNNIQWGGSGTLCGCSSTGYNFYTDLESCCPPDPNTTPPATITVNDGTNTATLTWNNNYPPTWSGSTSTFVGCSPATITLVCQPAASYFAVNSTQFLCGPTGGYYPLNLSTCTATSGCDSNSYTVTFSTGVGFISRLKLPQKQVALFEQKTKKIQNCCDDESSQYYSFDVVCPNNSNVLEASGFATKTSNEFADTYTAKGIMKSKNIPCESSEYTLIYSCNKKCADKLNSKCCWDIEALSIKCIDGISCNIIECDCNKSPKFKFQVIGNNFNCGCCSDAKNNS